MDDPSGPSFLNLLIGMIPLLALIGVFIWFIRRTGQRSPPPNYWNDHLTVERESLEARRETNRLLAELAAKLDR